MDWRDEGALLSVRRHGEGSAIVEVFTAQHGRHSGIVRGGGARKMAPILQPGAQLQVEWRARLEDHLGMFVVEPLKSRAANILADRCALAVMGSVSALLHWLPEREAHVPLYQRTIALLDGLDETADWHANYVIWELALLAEMGFGLDLRDCAATGATDDLIYVSPKSGRAVSRVGGAEWSDRLLALPAFLRDGAAMASSDDLVAGLRLTGHFLEHWLAPAVGVRETPAARARACAALLRYSTER
jgi:DNA repair protein RecO (recombination protein O)